MSEGELLQAQKARSFDINEDLYLKIIRKKPQLLWQYVVQLEQNL